jgi:hypothetical protein
MGCVCRRPGTIVRQKPGAQVSTTNSVKFCLKCGSRITVIPTRGEGSRMFYQYVPCGCRR